MSARMAPTCSQWRGRGELTGAPGRQVTKQAGLAFKGPRDFSLRSAIGAGHGSAGAGKAAQRVGGEGTPARGGPADDEMGARVSQARAVAQVIDQVLSLSRRSGDAHHTPAVDELLLDLVAPARLDANGRLARLLRRNAGWRRRKLGKRFELGRLLRCEGQRDSEKRESKDSARHRAKFHFPASLSEPLRIRGLKDDRAMF